MKSRKAIYFLDRKSPVIVHPVSKSVTYYSLSRYDAERAVELAEQEAEERMREKAHKIVKEMMTGIFHGNMPQKIADEFIQKLTDDEND